MDPREKKYWIPVRKTQNITVPEPVVIVVHVEKNSTKSQLNTN
jgi:hypothetical protein